MLHKTQTVLEKASGSTYIEAVVEDDEMLDIPCVKFASQEPAVNSYREMWFDTPTWEEMGSPEIITITIVPGDALNEEG